MNAFNEMQKLAKEALDATMQSLETVAQGAQTMATEAAEFTRKSFDDGRAATDKLMSARSFERIVEVQSQYAESAYESLMAQGAKFSEIYATMAKQAYGPFENYLAKARAAS